MPFQTREEQHRYASNLLTLQDFSTEYPTGYHINKVASSIEWTIKNEKNRLNLLNMKEDRNNG